MKVYVFLGPTLPAETARAELDAVYLPPVSQGDVYRVGLTRPRAIGIVDGYFARVPAVWHKEILWAMSEGIHVFGSASMGALRAAELAAFGMEGVGEIFAAYRDGLLEDDDEVAVAHGLAEEGYRTQSEAMVNVRATLAAATTAGVLAPATAEALAVLAKALYYPERSYPLLLRRAAEAGLPGPELAALRAWLPTGQVDQKRTDALAMLRQMRAWLATEPPPKRVRYRLEHTIFWDEAQRSAGAPPAEQDGALPLETLLDELRLDPVAYEQATRGALLRHLALGEARRQGCQPDGAAIQAAADAFRRARGLFEPEDVAAWLAEHHLTRTDFDTLMREEALLAWVRTHVEPEGLARLPDYLRLSGTYAALDRRARDKQVRLAARGLEQPRLADLGLTEEALVAWYFAEAGRALPDDLDAYAQGLGYGDSTALLRALAREYAYLQLHAEAPACDG